MFGFRLGTKLSASGTVNSDVDEYFESAAETTETLNDAPAAADTSSSDPIPQLKCEAATEPDKEVQKPISKIKNRRRRPLPSRNAGDPGLTRLNTQMAALLDANDLLCSEGAGAQLLLPEVVVVGDQSDGKSTLLEAISGVRLPKGHGICTRCPIRICIRSAATESAAIQFGDTKEEIQNLAELEEKLAHAQRRVAGESDTSISTEPIWVWAKGPGLPNLSVVDLPGINRLTTTNEDALLELIRTWISREETVIVVVAKATNDIATSKGNQMALEVDPHRERTILVLTNCDAVQKNWEAPVSKLLLEMKDLLFAVKCFRDESGGATREELFNQETQFFNEHSVFRNHRNVGTMAVIDSLETMLCETLAPMQQEILVLAMKRNSELKLETQDMNTGISKAADRCVYAVRREFEEQVTGSHRFMPNSVYSRCRSVWEKFGKKIIDTSAKLKDNIHAVVRKERKEQVGRENVELSNDFPVMERIIKQLVEDFEPTVEAVINDTQDIVFRALTSVVTDQLEQFNLLSVPELRQTLCKGVAEQREACVEEARIRCREILEMQKIVFTNNPGIQRLINAKVHDWFAQKGLEQSGQAATSSEPTVSKLFSELRSIAKPGSRARELGEVGLLSISQRFGISPFMVQSLLDFIQTRSHEAGGDSVEWDDEQRLIAILHVYIDLVRDRVVDAIPMALIHFVNHKMAEDVCELVPQLTSEKLNEFLEHPDRLRELQKLTERSKQWSDIVARLHMISLE